MSTMKSPNALKKTAGTERWPASCVAKGEFILLPKVLVKRFAHLKITPQELLLILMLQVDRYEDRKPRFYWEQLAEWCGLTKHAVRKWGYSLKDKSLLSIRTRIKRDLESKRKVGQRNDRNEFDLAPFLTALETQQTRWEDERSAGKRGSPGVGQ